MIDRATAESLLDLGSRQPGGDLARRQLDGAVALHNILEREGTAYLADEVGMGKTYIALATAALFRHFNPRFSVLVIAPRANIQAKWIREYHAFVAHHLRFADLRNRGADGRPVRPPVSCENLPELLREVTLDPHRDFFTRLTSFSMPVHQGTGGERDAVRPWRDAIRAALPWIDRSALDLRNVEQFKGDVARAINCGLPTFDLVIVDEAHHLKHGFTPGVAARNAVLAGVFGRAGAGDDPRRFRGYGPRAARVLFLSATPIEESYRHLWNQLDVFGFGDRFPALAAGDPVAAKRDARRIVVRRVRELEIAGETFTKNGYRREWRGGGMSTHDEPIRIEDARQRLSVALVQKKVAETLGHERFNSSFQTGMLASFESFLETAATSRGDDGGGAFDDSGQAEDATEREGVDVAAVDRIARHHRRTFGAELPHPKMDRLVDALSDAWRTGRKALVFVRRVASVRELKRKLDERYDAWLLARLAAGVPPVARRRLARIERDYREERLKAIEAGASSRGDDSGGGSDTFFAWFFRGEGPPRVTSGANIQQRFGQASSIYGTFFEMHHVADLLGGCPPAEVPARLAAALGVTAPVLRDGLRSRARRYLTRAKKHGRGELFEAAQAAAFEWLGEVGGDRADEASGIWRERFAGSLARPHADEAPDVDRFLVIPTFFTELATRPELRERIWPASAGGIAIGFRERFLRAQLLAAAARLGHAFIDLYLVVLERIGSLDRGAQEEIEAGGDATSGLDTIHAYLDLLGRQMADAGREWSAFDELSQVASHYRLIVDVNLPEFGAAATSETSLAEARRLAATLLGRQQPVGGMSGDVNRTMVRQFRMPGYPLVLISTDLLQEGEDLHTFCSEVVHYGISWTPSSIEQRIGRVDRVGSQVERRLRSLDRRPDGAERLQVYYPYLGDTVEVLQVRRVLGRVNEFLRLMHEGIVTAPRGDPRIDIGRSLLAGGGMPLAIETRLTSSFGIDPKDLVGDVRALAVEPRAADSARARFRSLFDRRWPGVEIEWSASDRDHLRFGTMRMAGRIQPFTLQIRSFGPRLLIRCTSPVGIVRHAESAERVRTEIERTPVRVAAIELDDGDTYDLSVIEDVLLATDPASDVARAASIVRRACSSADRLELALLPDRDRDLAEFRPQLEREATSDG